MILYINRNCDRKRGIKVKEITNYIDSSDDYSTKVIISCYLQDEWRLKKEEIKFMCEL